MLVRCAVQAIYSWQLSGNDIADVELGVFIRAGYPRCDIAYFRELLVGVAINAARLDKAMEPYLSRQLEELEAKLKKRFYVFYV